MDYRDGYDYREICKAAVQRDIVINTVQCGEYLETASFWRDIAKRAEGSYASVAQDGGMQVVETPFDAEIAALSAKLEDTRVPFGSRESIASSRTKKERAKEMIADMVMITEAARFLCYQAYYLLNKGVTCFREASMAKAFSTEMAIGVTSKAIQIHGAYGISEEYPVERYFRDARSLTFPDGATQIQKLIIGREMLGLSAFA